MGVPTTAKIFLIWSRWSSTALAYGQGLGSTKQIKAPSGIGIFRWLIRPRQLGDAHWAGMVVPKGTTSVAVSVSHDWNSNITETTIVLIIIIEKIIVKTTGAILLIVRVSNDRNDTRQ